MVGDASRVRYRFLFYCFVKALITYRYTQERCVVYISRDLALHVITLNTVVSAVYHNHYCIACNGMILILSMRLYTMHTFPPNSCIIRSITNSNGSTKKRSGSISCLLRKKTFCTYLSLLIHVYDGPNMLTACARLNLYIY